MATPLLGAEQLHLEYPTKVVFDGLSVGIEEGDRIGIVGKNGDGKSSLLALLSGDLPPQAGRVTRRSGLRVGVLHQSDRLDDAATVGEFIVGGRAEHEWASQPRIRQILNALVADIPFQRRVGELSGGQRRRVSLAALLIEEWDLIFLDEPTNHLDLEAINFLAEHLKTRWPKNSGALVVVTHDRWFLDEVCSETWEVHDGVVEPFEGGYAAYVLQRVERDRIAAATEQKRQNLMRKELAWLRRGAPARTSKPKFRIDAANALIADVPPVRDSLQLQRMAVARQGKDVIDLENVSLRRGEQELFRGLTWRLAPGRRYGILGPNGAGKTSLLKLLSGELEPTTGRVKHGKTVKFAVLDQQFSQLRSLGKDRVREVLGRLKTTFEVDGKELSGAQLLERLGFLRAHLSTRVEELSGGQKRRLQLLLILCAEPNVLALDEPTNDVDADMLTALEDLLDSWPGTLVVISHDRYLLERVTDEQYALLAGSFRHLPGGVEEYLRLQAELSQQAQHGAGGAGTGPQADAGTIAAATTSIVTSSAKTASSAGAEKLGGAQRQALLKEFNMVERQMQKTTQSLSGVEEQMAQVDPQDYTTLAELGEEAAQLRENLEELELRWLELAEILN